jgi:biotin transporter BioY
MIFEKLHNSSQTVRRDHFFRVLGYGTIILLLGFLRLSFFFESSKWSNATGEMLLKVLGVIVVSALAALTVLSWLQTEEETRGQTLLAIKKLWPVLAWCLPSLLGLGLLSFSIFIADHHRLPGLLEEFYIVWFLFVAPVATLFAFLVFVRRKWTGRVAILPALLACVVLIASVLANLFALLVALFNGANWHSY